MRRPKTGRMEVRRDGEDRFFYQDSDFEIESGAGQPKVAENGPNFFRKWRNPTIRNPRNDY